MTKEKVFKVYWSLQGSFKIKAKNRSEAVDKIANIRDISDECASYTVNHVKEVFK